MNEPSAPTIPENRGNTSTSVPDQDKDLPPSYDSLFPPR